MRSISQSVIFVATATMLVIGRPAAAQTKIAPEGWPDQPSTTKTVIETPKAVPSAKGVTPAAPAPKAPAKATAAKATEPAKNTAAPTVAELMQVLEQQSAILARLGADVEAQNTIIASQQTALQRLQSAPGSVTAATPASVAPAAAAAATSPKGVAIATAPPAPVLPVITVDTAAAKLHLSGLFQGWFTAGDAGAIDTFRLRRTEFKFAGDISAKAHWTVMIDPSKALAVTNTYTTVAGAKVVSDTSVSQSGRVLQDAFLSVGVAPHVTVDLGQQKIPLGLEGTQSSAKLSMVDRALFVTDKARGGGWGDVRDLGVVARGQGAGGHVEYWGGVFNGLGESMNDVDHNNQKAVAGRIAFKPVTGLQFGGSFARGSVTTIDPSQREREGLDMLFTHGRFGAQAELMTGHDGAVTRRGYYVQGRARATRTVEFLARYDTFDPNTSDESTAAVVTERDWLGGVNFLVAGPGVQFQVNYVHKAFGTVQASKNLFLANLQAVW